MAFGLSVARIDVLVRIERVICTDASTARWSHNAGKKMENFFAMQSRCAWWTLNSKENSRTACLRISNADKR